MIKIVVLVATHGLFHWMALAGPQFGTYLRTENTSLLIPHPTCAQAIWEDSTREVKELYKIQGVM